jgi:NADH:ubiquinone oxidoreductase subunit E
MITVTICVGSSCHIKGAREMIARFNEFLNKEGLQDKVELKGSFCMERCGEGINWKINDEILSSSSVEEGAEIFKQKVMESLKTKSPEGSTNDPGERRV